MFHFEYKTKNTCAFMISMDLDGDRVYNVKFRGGCNGNLQGVSRLVDGKTVDEISDTLAGIRCGFKPTSCPDQLSLAVRAAREAQKNAL